MEFVAAQGGYGGKGNVHFKSSTNQTPFYAQKGKPAIEAELHLELKLIAHIGLVGFPNAGKSTLISRITNAKPKIAAYPFTTLEPNLGVMNLEAKYASVMIADIPGLIEGAHKGKGLGIEFLKHIERTKIILYILDITEDPMEKFRILREELKGYSKALFDRDFLVALNKIDLDPDRETTQKLLTDFAAISPNTMAISGHHRRRTGRFKMEAVSDGRGRGESGKRGKLDAAEDRKSGTGHQARGRQAGN